MTILFLARHEESVTNRNLKNDDGQLFYARTGSDKRVPLTRRGRRRALALGRTVADLLEDSLNDSSSEVTAYTSEFRRTKETFHRLNRSLQLRVPLVPIVDPRLNKRDYGEFWNLTYKGVRTLHPEEYELFQRQGARAYRPPGGENYDDLKSRVSSFIDERVQDSDGTTLVVSHSAVLLTFLQLLDGLDEEEVVRLYESNFVKNGQLIVFRKTAPGRWLREQVD